MKEEVIAISELQVLQSGAGYYIGTSCDVKYTDPDGTEWVFRGEPNTRDSGYFETFEEASNALKNGFEVRQCIENGY